MILLITTIILIIASIIIVIMILIILTIVINIIITITIFVTNIIIVFIIIVIIVVISIMTVWRCQGCGFRYADRARRGERKGFDKRGQGKESQRSDRPVARASEPVDQGDH